MSTPENVAIFGGSFDPPHLGHIAVIESLDKVQWIDKIIVIPSFHSPLKSQAAAAPEHRLEMLKICIIHSKYKKKIEISKFEIEQVRPVFTIETLNHFKSKNTQNNYYLVIGSDHLFQFKKWVKFEDILRLHHIIIINRNNNTAQTLNNFILQEFTPQQQEHIHINLMPENKSASSTIRQLNGLSPDCPESIITYIKKHNLYQ